jgi:hypothetical protein
MQRFWKDWWNIIGGFYWSFSIFFSFWSSLSSLFLPKTTFWMFRNLSGVFYLWLFLMSEFTVLSIFIWSRNFIFPINILSSFSLRWSLFLSPAFSEFCWNRRFLILVLIKACPIPNFYIMSIRRRELSYLLPHSWGLQKINSSLNRILKILAKKKTSCILIF